MKLDTPPAARSPIEAATVVPPAAARIHRRCGPLPVDLLRVHRSPGESFEPPRDRFAVVVCRSARPLPLRVRRDAAGSRLILGPSAVLPLTGVASLAPAGRGEAHLLCVAAPWESLAAALRVGAGELVDRLQAAGGRGAREPAASGRLRGLWAWASSGDPVGAAAVHYEVLRLVCGMLEPAKATRRESPLAGIQVEGLVAFIEQRLEDPLGPADLARRAGMSTGRFSRRWRASTGVSPYQYILQRRVERARVLLRENLLSVLQVAHACGFNSQSHLTDVFHTRVGVTPSVFRRESTLVQRERWRSVGVDCSVAAE